MKPTTLDRKREMRAFRESPVVAHLRIPADATMPAETRAWAILDAIMGERGTETTRLGRMVLRILKGDMLATEDLIQDVLVSLASKHASEVCELWELEKIVPHVTVCVRNAALNARKRAKWESGEMPLDVASQEKESYLLAAQCVAAMPSYETRQVASAVLNRDLVVGDALAEYGVSKGTWHRACSRTAVLLGVPARRVHKHGHVAQGTKVWPLGGGAMRSVYALAAMPSHLYRLL